MTTKSLTGLLAKPAEADGAARCTTGERLFQIAFGAIQWPWLLKSLYGGTQAEKQALLAGIGVGKQLLDNAQSRGLHNELQNLGLKNKNVNYYAEQVDNIAGQVGIDLDQINLSWLRRFLPATAVIVGMRYNSSLIDEVIGVAQATFGPEPKLANKAITDDSGSEAKVETSDSNKKDKTEQDKQSDKESAKTSDDNKQTNDKSDVDDKKTDNNAKSDETKQDKQQAQANK